MNYRKYQQDCEAMARERFISGDKKIMIWLATGGGKSILLKNMIKKTIQNNFSVLFLVRRRELIFQAYNKHFKPIGLDCSVIMGNEKGFKKNCSFQICSIDTISRRIKSEKYSFIKDFDFLFIDEAHDTTSKKYQEVLNQINFKGCFGYTATPFRVGNKVHDWWDSCVKPIEMHELRDQGYLVPAKVFAPKVIDTTGIKKVGADFHQGELFDRVSENKIVGDIIETYKKYGQNKPAILFAVNIAHSTLMSRAFNDAGIPAMHCDQSHSKEERESAIEALTNGQIKVLCNINIFSTGVDVPAVEIGIMARPTMSETLYVQQVGRFLRPYKVCKNCLNEYGAEKTCWNCGSSETNYKKEFAIILDHANNTSRHGLPYRVRDAQLKKSKKNKKQENAFVKICKECFAVLEQRERTCPLCGSLASEQKGKKEIEHVDGELSLVDQTPLIKDKFNKLKWRERKFYKNHTEKYFLLHKEFGDIVFDVIDFPEWIHREIQRDGLLRSASRIIERHNDKNAKKVFTN